MAKLDGELEILIKNHAAVLETGLLALPGLAQARTGSKAKTLRFSFGCFGIPFSASVERVGACGILRFDGFLGPMPYSIEAPRARARIREVLSRARDAGTARLMVDDDHQLRIAGTANLPLPVRPKDILGETTSALACLKCHIDALSECLPSADAERRRLESARTS
ncbi:MAG: hypothetical protein ACKVSF_03330 [Alphaproteobacteria bacterium]